MELVDVPDSKSGVGNYVPVRPRPSAFFYTRIMKVQNIESPGVRLSFGAQKKNTFKARNINKPLKDSISTAGAWFGFGVVLDLISRKIRVSKSPTKNSLAINGILGLGAGIFTGVSETFFKHSDSVSK